MNSAQRLTLLRTGNPRAGESWADLGCGDGAFTVLLADELGPEGSLLALDRDAQAINHLRSTLAATESRVMADVILRVEGLTELSELPSLDGALLANVLHYLPGPASVLSTLREAMRPGGRILLVEYDRSDPNTWVPHPIPVAALPGIAQAAGIPPFEVMARVPSDFGRVIYAAVSRLGIIASGQDGTMHRIGKASDVSAI